MWLSRRAALLGCFALAGCGFEPVYGNRGAANPLRGAVQMDAPQSRNEFLLNEQIELRLGRSSAPRYGLSVVLSVKEEGLAITQSNDIERFNVIGEAKFLLRDLTTNAPVISDKVNTFTAYSASQQPVTTLAAQRDARARLMTVLADKIVSQLLLNADQLSP
jgi:LPS-assembly lipoprotein